MSCTLTIKNLSIFKNEKTILKNIDINLSHKCKVAILGDNGIGKTTFLKSIVGLEKIDGLIEFFHKRVSSEKEFKEARKNIGFLFQNPDDQLITTSVLEELTFTLLNKNFTEDEAVKIAKEYLKKFNISYLENELPINLSGGQKKLVALLSILVDEPKILLLDEPSSYLDNKSEKNIKDILINTDKTMIITSHNYDFIKDIATAIYKLNSNGLEKVV